MKKPLLLSLIFTLTLWLGCSNSNSLETDRIEYELGFDYSQATGLEGQPLSTAEKLALQEESIKILKKRLKSLKVKNFDLQISDDHLLLKIPVVSVQLQSEIEMGIQNQGLLEFRLVHIDNAKHIHRLYSGDIVPPGYLKVRINDMFFFKRDENYKGDRASDSYKQELANTGRISPFYDLMLEKEYLEDQSVYSPTYVDIRPLLDGSSIKFSHPDYDAYGRAQVELSLTSAGKKKFFEITKDYAPEGRENPTQIGRRLAIVVDQTLYSAPTINVPISGGSAVISGSFDYKSANTISNALNSGALPLAIEILSKQVFEKDI